MMLYRLVCAALAVTAVIVLAGSGAEAGFIRPRATGDSLTDQCQAGQTGCLICTMEVPTCKESCPTGQECKVTGKSCCSCPKARCVDIKEGDSSNPKKREYKGPRDDQVRAVRQYNDDSAEYDAGNESSSGKSSERFCVACFWAPTCDRQEPRPGKKCVEIPKTCRRCAEVNWVPI